MKNLCFIILVFIAQSVFSNTTGLIGYATNTDSTNTKPPKRDSQLATEGPVRKTIFKIKGKPVDRQVYFDYLKCKHCRSQLIGSSVFIGIGAAALAGSIPLLMRANKFDTEYEQLYGGLGIVLANLSAFGFGIGIHFTIKNSKEYKGKYNGNCNYTSMLYLCPQLNGLGMAYRF